ncbi:hypothetical protein R6Z07F_014819 [Ovis aries]
MQGILGRPGPPRQEAAGKAGPRDLRRGAFQSRAKKTGTFLALLPLWRRMTGFDRTVRASIWALQLGFIVLTQHCRSPAVMTAIASEVHSQGSYLRGARTLPYLQSFPGSPILAPNSK